MTLFDGSPARAFGTSVGTSDARVLTPTIRWIVLIAFCTIAVLTAMYVWFGIFQVRLERPATALFGGNGNPFSLSTTPGQALKGWTAWYIPALATAFASAVIFNRLIRPPQRWSVLVFTVAGCCAVLIGTWIAQWVEHNGFMWYNRPEMTLRLLLSVQAQVAAVSFGEALVVLKQQWVALAIGGGAGTGLAICVNAPVRSRLGYLVVDVADTQPTASREQSARIISTVVLLIASQTGSRSGDLLAMLAIGLCVCLAWYVISFPRVAFDIKRLLLGSFVSAIAASLIQTISLAQKKTDFATAFKNTPGMPEIMFMMHIKSFAMLMIFSFLGFATIFFLTAKITVALCHRRRPAN